MEAEEIADVLLYCLRRYSPYYQQSSMSQISDTLDASDSYIANILIAYRRAYIDRVPYLVNDPADVANTLDPYAFGSAHVQLESITPALIESLTMLGSNTALKRAFDALFKLLGDPMSTFGLVPIQGSPANGDLRLRALVTIGQKLGSEFVMNHISRTLDYGEESERLMALQLLTALDVSMVPISIQTRVLAAVEEDSAEIQPAALEVAQVLLQGSAASDIVDTITKSLSHREYAIRDRAWQILVEHNRATDVWR
jgi:hypothetical protein